MNDAAARIEFGPRAVAGPVAGFESARLGMGTVVTQQAYGPDAREAMEAAIEEVERLESLLSRFLPDSDVGRLNASAGNGDVELGDEAYAVLERAADFAASTEGRIDVTVAPLVDVWRDAAARGRAPRQGEIDSALALVGYGDVALDPAGRTASLRRDGMAVDLGGIGKGFSADRMVGVYRAHGVESAFVNLGGNVAALGAKPDGSPWRIGVRDPRGDGLLGAVSVRDASVVTSGDYQRYFLGADGTRYHHILDPASGYPATSGLASATVVSGSSCAADALSTAVFVAGLQSGIELVRGCLGTEFVLVDVEGQVFVSAGLAGCLETVTGVDVHVV